MLVLGAGLQGSACAFDLLETTDAQVTIADLRPPTLPDFLEARADGRLAVIQLDATDEAAVSAQMREHDAVMCALPYYFNLRMTRLAIEAGVHFADLGGNTDIVRQQEALSAEAEAKCVTVTPDCGLAPGMANIVAAASMCHLDQTRSVKIFVGGLPQHPRPPLNYQVVYSLEGALDYYTTPSWILRDGEAVQVDALSEIEPVSFPAPLGVLEAFHTGGGISTMPWQFEGTVDRMEYKTLRYPGHAEIMRAIRELGLLDLAPVDVRGTPVRPRDVFIAAVDAKLRRPDSEDLVALQVVATGTKDGQPKTVTYRLLDFYDGDHRISAMERTTGYSLSITGQMQVDGRLSTHGVRPAYQTTPFAEYVAELRRRGIMIESV
jgi:lysine 6-dehydrogenase